MRFATLRLLRPTGYLLPGSCTWNELTVYLRQRIEAGEKDEADTRRAD